VQLIVQELLNTIMSVLNTCSYAAVMPGQLLTSTKSIGNWQLSYMKQRLLM